MAGQLFAPLDRAKRHLNSRLQLFVALAAADHFEAALEHRQQIVEIMGDAAGQLAQRLHLLRLVELRLGARPTVHLALQALRRGSPAPGRDLLLLQLASREKRHAEQGERGGDGKDQIIHQIGAPSCENAARRDAEDDVEREPADALVGEKTLDPVGGSLPAKRAALRLGSDCLHDRPVGGEDQWSRQLRIPYQHHAVGAHQQRREVFVL